MGRVVVVQNTQGGGPGRVGTWLRAAGADVEVVRPFDGDALPESLDGRALLVLGGGFMPDDDARAPWLPGTRRLAREALDGGTPYLGICLGGQLLAQVAGGAVRAAHGSPELGSTPIRLRPEAATDPLLHGLGSGVPAIERHVDAITELPPGAVWLASSELCPYQAFRVGPRAWGTQFHPEVSADRIARWDPAALAEHGLDRGRLLARARAAEPAAGAAWSAFTRRFAEVCRD
ncbi:type 1 glutamine amidotransferase [Streptomyces sp. SID5785]|uniref:type 1 glutamine amidotransferase n=1 Tax=Streptomyces sp. SID5785 TaxID=2690309 RepID=UPI0013618D38|nr:type 1 glutamine amidotransferase [Streptomyces sp. SID5785]MZD09233.1 type 1 glutamine amidotransferase [Streptomyces sp. SID5785]